MKTAADFRAWLNSPAVFKARGWSESRSLIPAPQHVGPIAAYLDQLCGGERERHSFLRYVFGVDSLKKLNTLQQNSLWAWLSPAPLDDGTWGVLPRCKHWAEACGRAALIEAGQMELVEVTSPSDEGRVFIPGAVK